MKKRKCLILISMIMVCMSMCLTGCKSGLVNYLLRGKPEVAMEKYIEEKYQDDVTLIDTNVEQSYAFFWNKSVYGATFSSEKIPNETIRVAAYVRRKTNTFYFRDNYQKVYHIKEIDDMVQELAAKYLYGDYYIKVYERYDGDNQELPMMSVAEYTSTYERCGVCILEKDMSDEDAIQLTRYIMQEIEEQGIRCSWSIGKYTEDENDPPIEERVIHEETFNPWMMKSFITFIYDKDFDGSEEYADTVLLDR